MGMFNLGLPELFVIGVAGLLIFGPKRLPEWAKGLGEGIREFKKAMNDDDKAIPPADNAPPHETLPPAKPVSSTPDSSGDPSKGPHSL